MNALARGEHWRHIRHASTAQTLAIGRWNPGRKKGPRFRHALTFAQPDVCGSVPWQRCRLLLLRPGCRGEGRSLRQPWQPCKPLLRLAHSPCKHPDGASSNKCLISWWPKHAKSRQHSKGEAPTARGRQRRAGSGGWAGKGGCAARLLRTIPASLQLPAAAVGERQPVLSPSLASDAILGPTPWPATPHPTRGGALLCSAAAWPGMPRPAACRSPRAPHGKRGLPAGRNMTGTIGNSLWNLYVRISSVDISTAPKRPGGEHEGRRRLRGRRRDRVTGGPRQRASACGSHGHLTESVEPRVRRVQACW